MTTAVGAAEGAVRVRRPPVAAPRARRGRLDGLDLARAIAMLGMLVVHTIGTHNPRPDAVLWTAYGWAAPLFVVLAGMGLSLGTRPPRPPRTTAMVVARAVLLLLLGLAVSPLGEGGILHYYGLLFLLGAAAFRLPTRALAVLAGLGLVAGPLLLTLLFRLGAIDTSISQSDIGLGALADPVALVRALALDGTYPAVVWVGFLFAGMVVGRLDLSSPRLACRLIGGGTVVAATGYLVGWAGARHFGSNPLGWTHHWTTYGHTEALAWTVSSTALVLAMIGAALEFSRWLTGAGVATAGDAAGSRRRGRDRARRLVAPVVALGRVALTFYLVHLAYAGTVWKQIDPYLTTTSTYVLATLAFWLGFALLAQQWLRRWPRGPVETVLHGIAVAVVRPRA